MFFLFLQEPDEDVTAALQYLRLPTIRADEFDFYWRKCASLRFKQIAESKSSAEILQLWPEYKRPSGSNLVSYIYVISTKFII